MKKLVITLSAISLAMAGLSGCANMSETQRDTGTGAAIGAVAGGLIGAATAGGNKGKSAATGAAIGAALGAGGAYLWSQNMQKQRGEMEQATAGTGIGISQTTDNQLKVVRRQLLDGHHRTRDLRLHPGRAQQPEGSGAQP